MIKFNDAPFVPCNDCANWESCQEDAYQQGAREFAKYVIDKIDDGYITHSSDIVDVLAEWQEEQKNEYMA